MRARTLPLRTFSLRFVLLALGAATLAGGPAAAQRVGIDAAVNTDATGIPPGAAARRLIIGQDVVHNEHITTNDQGQTQLLFVDGSSVSIGPQADMTIDDFVYNPSTGAGKMTLTTLKGAMRFVGGKLSKEDNQVAVNLPAATIGVRGGVFIADVRPGGNSEVIFVFGKALTITGRNGASQQLFRSGFAVDIDSLGRISPPHPAPPGAMVGILSRLDGRPGANGGATTVPTNTIVANSGIPNTVSNNVTASIQQAAQNSTAPTPTTTTPPTSQPRQVQTNQTQVATVAPTITTTTTTQTQTQTPASTPVQIQVVGAFKDAFVNGAGFTNAITSVTPFTGTIMFPAGTPQNGTLTASSGSSFGFTLSPLTPGATTNASAPSSAGTFTSGPATVTPDGNFFFANTVAATGDDVFFFGGTPVSQSFYAANPNTQFYAFAVQPDYTLADGSQAQTIPFLPSQYGGTMTNAVVSPFYVVVPANTSFGASNTTRYLQSSLAINGQGSSQTAAFTTLLGPFTTSSDTGEVVASSSLRGTYLAGGTALPVSIESGATTVPAANGSSLFGGTTLDGFVLDSNTTDANGNFVSSSATATTAGQTQTSYAFNQPVTATTLPSGVGANRTPLNETGFFGGVVTNGSVNYVLSGATVVSTDATNNTVSAVFAGTDPFTPDQSMINSVSMPFGRSTSAPAGTSARSTFIDDNIYAAVDNDSQLAQVNGAPVTSQSLAMVTSAAVPGAANALFQAAGATMCSCQYLQWGYWSSTLNPGSPPGPQVSYINTWIAGQPTVTMPTVGTGTYSGAAIGTVFNNGASYLAAGGFSNTYNFGSSTGTVAINNFDGASYAGTVQGSGNTYSGAIAGGTNRSGQVIGQFYGPGAAETGGNFALHATSGPSYIASGIFAGKR